MSWKPSQRTQQAWIDLHRSHRLLLEQVESALKRADLPPLDWYGVLLELRRERDTGLRPFRLGERVLLSKHNLSRMTNPGDAACFTDCSQSPWRGSGFIAPTSVF